MTSKVRVTQIAPTQFLKQNWLSLIILAAIVGFVGIHLVWYISPSEIKTMEELDARLTDGQPTVVEFYSNL